MRAVDLPPPGTPDNDVSELAAGEGRVAVTHDVNTMPAVADCRVADRFGTAGGWKGSALTPLY